MGCAISALNIPPAGTKWGDHYRKNIQDYYTCISGVDEQFGRILQALRVAGLAKNSIVVFTSDHGDCLGIHEEVTKNNRYTFVMNQEEGKDKIIMLYDRKDDPYQMKNIAAQNPGIVRELTEEMRLWLIKISDPWVKNMP